jgi:hypothetical protein
MEDNTKYLPNKKKRECLGKGCIEKSHSKRLFVSLWAGERVCWRCKKLTDHRPSDPQEN